ncbi:MAG: DUF354 domain-containing protein [Acidobacteriota bacterium]
MTRILVDLTHPAHVHFFRHSIEAWRERGHEVVLTARDKDIAVELLDRLGWAHRDLGAARSGLGGLAVELVTRTVSLSRWVRRLRPDVLTAIGGTWIAPVGRLCGVPSIVFYDTENATLSNLLTYRLATVISTPDCYAGRVPERKHLTYPGYHELAYTHPRRLTPDPGRLAAFGLDAREPFLFVRAVSWGASHDVRDHGFTDLEAAVRRLEPYGRVVISSEGALPTALEPLRLRGPEEEVHHVLAHARLYLGESATMASESATLGTPALFLSTSVRGYTDEQGRRYGLTFTFSDRREGQEQALRQAVSILEDPESSRRFAAARGRLLADKIDVTDHVVQLVERWGAR